jgi:hypothetical protein
MPIDSLLILLSTLIIFLLGALHLLLTFRGTSFHPRDRELAFKMKAVSPLISTQTTMVSRKSQHRRDAVQCYLHVPRV